MIPKVIGFCIVGLVIVSISLRGGPQYSGQTELQFEKRKTIINVPEID